MRDDEKVDLWRQRFFEAQAAAEEFVLQHHGPSGIEEWIAANARITSRLLESQRAPGVGRREHFVTRLLQQLSLYDSDASLSEREGAWTLDNRGCGILRYRRAAAARGVKLTFDSPCGYCQALNSSIARAYDPSTEVTCTTSGEGCRWTAEGAEAAGGARGA